MATHRLLFPLIIVAALLLLKGSCAQISPSPLVVKGRVFCDACRAGYFSRSSFYLPGAKVGVQCGTASGHVTAYAEGKTGAEGEFAIAVHGEHEGEVCMALVLHSAHPSCYLLSHHTAYATVVLSRHAGLADNVINTGPFAFTPNRVAPFCALEVASTSIAGGE